jgi:hypothetical protein
LGLPENDDFLPLCQESDRAGALRPYVFHGLSELRNGEKNACYEAMSISSVNPLTAANDLRPVSAKCTGAGSSPKTPSSGQLSTFAQLLNSSSGATQGSSSVGGSSSSSPNQQFSQLMSSFQSNGTQNQGQTLNPLSVW